MDFELLKETCVKWLFLEGKVINKFYISLCFPNILK